MSLRIKASTFLTKRYLDVNSDGVKFCEAVIGGGTRRFGFHEIRSILLSEGNLLSFQVNQEVFSIPVKPNKEKHRRVIDALVNAVKYSASGGTPTGV